MKAGSNKILTDLARPTSTAGAQTMGLLPSDDLDECVPRDNSSAVDSVAQPPLLTTFPAPPVVAPHQVSYVVSQSGAAKRRHQRCFFYFPFCLKFAYDCDG
jgi:hypothetical protein